MPFRRQQGVSADRTSPSLRRKPESPPSVGSDDWRRTLNQAAARLRAAGVGVVYLIHGTFVGADAAGILVELGRLFPSVREKLATFGKSLLDAAVQDNGNYVAEFATAMEEALNVAGSETIEVRTFVWSGENHHLGRADAAVRLIDEFASVELPPGKRILAWGHSHAGNALALLTNLATGEPERVTAFFQAARQYYRVPLLGIVDVPIWNAVEDFFRHAKPPIIAAPLDIVTFGTPIRYGWDERGFDKLLHFVNHRVPQDAPPRRPALPQLADVLRAVDGDYVQLLGIAGTDMPPSPVAWRAWSADRRLAALLEPDASPLDLLARLQVGRRVSETGDTLLVDYGEPDGSLPRHLAGHAVYTRLAWLPFHAAETAERLYARREPAF